MPRCQDEDIGAAVERGEFILADGAEHAHPRAEAARGNLRRKPVRRDPIAGAIAGNGEPPVEIGEPGERIDENVVALARHHRADREKFDGIAARPRRRRDPVVAGQGNGDRRVRDAVIGHQHPPRSTGW